MNEAALHGSIDAMYGYAKLIQKDDPQKAFELYKVAAKYGSSYAEYQIGKMLCFGQGVAQNYKEGMEWLRESAKHGNTHAEALHRHVYRALREELISASLLLIRGLAMMMESQGEEQYQQVDWTDSRAKEETNRKKYAIGYRYSGPKLRM